MTGNLSQQKQGPGSWLAYPKPKIGAYESRELYAYVRHISGLSGEF